MSPLVGVVLAGGRSSRMGGDKAVILVPSPWGPTPMGVRVAMALRPFVDRVVVVGRGVLPLAFPDGVEIATIVEDDAPHHPLRGVVAAATAHPGARLLIAPCDLPFLDPADVGALVAAAGAGEAVARDGAQVLPLLAVIGPHRAGQARSWADGGGSARGWVAGVPTVALRPLALADADVPEDLPPLG